MGFLCLIMSVFRSIFLSILTQDIKAYPHPRGGLLAPNPDDTVQRNHPLRTVTTIDLPHLTTTLLPCTCTNHQMSYITSWDRLKTRHARSGSGLGGAPHLCVGSYLSNLPKVNELHGYCMYIQ